MNIFLSASLLLMFLCMTEGILTSLPPRMTSIFEQEYWLAGGVTSTLTLSCQASGKPPPEYEWHFKGQPIASTQDRTITEGELQIRKARNEYFGEYQCYAKNVNGRTMTPAFHIRKAELNLFDNPKDIQDIKVLTNSVVSLKCRNAPSCVPKDKCRFEWKIGEGTEGSVTADKRKAVDAEGTLYFVYALPEDTTDALKPYACGVSNTVMKSYNKGSLTVLSVLPDISTVDQVVKVRFNGDVSAKLGSDAVLQCIFSGRDIKAINWYKGGTKINPTSNGKYSHPGFAVGDEKNQRKLIIKGVEESHIGSYKCEALQDPGNTAEAYVFLQVTGPPQFTETMSNQVKPIGSRAVFKCKTRSLKMLNPPKQPVWYANSQRITAFGDSSQKYSKSADSTELYVNNLQKDYTTNIQCWVENDYGYNYADSYLVVIEKTVITAQPPSEIKLLPGSTRSLYVNATADERFNLEYSWSFTDTDGKVIEQKDFNKNIFILTDMNRNLTIDASNLEGDEIFQVVGDYQAKISHEHDTKVVTVNITTDSSIVKPGGQTVQSAGFDSWLFAVIGGIIFLLIVIVLIVCLLHRNRGGDYNVDKKELAAGHDPAKELENGGLHELSRAYDDHNPTDDRLSLTDNVKDLSSDDEDYREYDLDDDTGKFNEDGSFIGQYGDKHLHSTQSTV